ncbi:linker for activation of T-cells family member 1 isoform X1 [Brachyhypopomus gauderio]|uniref:linker for activation of T-cells family member 1 isoform X1 n=1 Tax=Brachyhypopomus gauderio TaxID=698409 RepID=UPI0040434727
MDLTTVVTVVGVVMLLSVIILTSLCLNCKRSSQPRKIPENYPQHENPVSQVSGFTIIRPYAETIRSNTLSPVDQPHTIISPSMRDPRCPSPCPSPDGSQSDYVNEEERNGYEEPPESDKNDYLDVLPDELSPPSLASSGNSVYQNMGSEEKSDDEYSDSRDYINHPKAIIQTPIGSFASCSSDGQDSSDYVNAPYAAMADVNIHLG